jgi:uncharacterized protein YprB with RNaseH-like and TPR domain
MNPYIVLDIETTGLSPFKNQITCICAKTHTEELFKEVCTDEYSEESLLHSFLSWFKDLENCKGFNQDIKIVGHAVETFDLPFIIVRAMNFIPKEGFDNLIPVIEGKNTFDTKLESEFLRQPGMWLSLNNVAKVLGLPGQKTGNGLEAIKQFNEGRYDELLSYCWQDVLLTEQVYLKLLEKKEVQ